MLATPRAPDLSVDSDNDRHSQHCAGLLIVCLYQIVVSSALYTEAESSPVRVRVCLESYVASWYGVVRFRSLNREMGAKATARLRWN